MNRETTNKQHDQQNTTQPSNQDNPIDAKDSSRNNERDQRIKEEPDTERLRSERESTMNHDPE